MRVFTCDLISAGSQLSGHVFSIRAVVRASPRPHPDLLCAGDHTETQRAHHCYILTHMDLIKAWKRWRSCSSHPV